MSSRRCENIEARVCASWAALDSSGYHNNFVLDLGNQWVCLEMQKERRLYDAAAERARFFAAIHFESVTRSVCTHATNLKEPRTRDRKTAIS